MAALSPITLVFNAVDNASSTVTNLVNNVNSSLQAQLRYYTDIKNAFADLANTGSQAYGLLIGQNVTLREQLLSTQATLVATNKILENGIEIKDPMKAVESLSEPVAEAINKIRQGSLELVGVTSAELIPLFQITAQSSASIGASLNESADLTLSFAAALGTLQIPLEMAQQELNSIYTAQITSDSQLAKSLSINNQMVNQWRSQGVLVERLTEKLSAFRAGNTLAAQTINGVKSNIEEIVQEITRVAGEPFLMPIVNQLNVIYKFLQDNKKQIQSILVGIVDLFLYVGTELGKVIGILQPVLQTLAEAIFTQAASEGRAFANVIITIVETLQMLVTASAPVLQIVANIVKVFADLSSTDIGGLILQATLFTTIIGKLAISTTAFVTIQLLPFLVSLVPAFLGAANAARLFWLATQGNAAAQLALQALTPTLATITAAFISASGGVAGFIAASKALLAIPAVMSAIAVSLTAVATAAAFAWREQKKLADTTEALEIYRQTNEQIMDQSLKTAKGLRELNQAEKDNGFLTKEQIKEKERLQRVAKNQIEMLKSQLSSLKELQAGTTNEAQRNAQEAQIKTIERYIGMLTKQSSGVTLQSKDLRELGNDYQQLSKKINDATNQFKNTGDETIFSQSAKEIVDFTNKQVDLGQISSEQAIKQLELVRNSTKVEIEQRLAAQDAINKIRQSEVDETVQTLDSQANAINRLISGEIISQVEGQKQITYNKILQLKEQLNAVRQSIKEETELRRSQIDVQIKDIDKQIAEAEKRKLAAQKAGSKQNIRLADQDINKLEKDKIVAQQSLKIDSQRLQDLKKQEDKFKTDIDKTVVQQRTEQRQQRLKDFAEQQSILEDQNARKLITQEQFNERSLKIARAKANEELRVLAEQEKKLRPGREGKDGREEIAAKRADVRKKLAEDIGKFEEQKSQIRLSRIDAEQKKIESDFTRKLTTEEQFYKQSFENTKKRLDLEQQEIDRKRSKLKSGDSRLDVLAGQEAEINKKRIESVEKFEEQKAQVRLNRIDAENKAITANLAEGQLTEAQFYKQSFENTKKRLDSEQQEIDRKRSKLKPGDSRLAVLDGQSAEVRKKQADNFIQYQQNQLVVLERSQKKAKDIVAQSEQDRLNVIARLEADKVITKVQADELKINSSRKTIESDLKLEREKLAKLESLPKYNDPIKEEEKQRQIRESRKRTSELTKSLIDNEVSQRDAAFRVFEDQENKKIQRLQNQVTAETQILENQQKLNEYATKNLGIQQQLLNSRKDLISSTTNYLEGELNVLGELTRSEIEKKRLAESAAEIKLKAVQEQAVFEKKILEINLAQNEAALENERIQLRIDTLKARAATLSAQAEERIIENDTTLDKETKANKLEAARLKTNAAIMSEGLLSEQEKLLDFKELANKREADVSRVKLRNSSRLSEDQARLALANARVNIGQGNWEKSDLKKEIESRRLRGDDGTNIEYIDRDTGRNLRFNRRETDFDLKTFNRDGSVKDPRQDAIQQRNIEETRKALSQALGLPYKDVPMTPIPEAQKGNPVLKQAGFRSPEEQRQELKKKEAEFNEFWRRQEEEDKKAKQFKAQSIFTGTLPTTKTTTKTKENPVTSPTNVTVNISNTFNPDDVNSKKAASKLGEQIRSEMFDIFTLANKR